MTQDEAGYFTALAQWHAQKAGAKGGAAEAYLAGKYFVKASNWQAAEHWLQTAVGAADWATLNKADQARTWMYYGLDREQAGDLSAARSAYETAIGLNPTLTEPQIKLLDLVQHSADKAQTDRLVKRLLQTGPTYRLGQFGGGATRAQAAALPNGWTLVGYDVDEESLENGGAVTMWVWWPGPINGTPKGKGWVGA